MRRTPLFPSLVACQNFSLPMPLGLTAPIPVMTTRRFMISRKVVLPFPTRQYRLEAGMYAGYASGSNRERREAPGSSYPGPRHVLAGLQAGVLGAFLILACVMVGSLWDGRSIW